MALTIFFTFFWLIKSQLFIFPWKHDKTEESAGEEIIRILCKYCNVLDCGEEIRHIQIRLCYAPHMIGWLVEGYADEGDIGT